MVDLDLILNESIEMNEKIKPFLMINNTESDKEKFQKEMEKTYCYLHCNNKAIFNLIMSGSMEIEKLKYMIGMLKQVKNNEISSEKAEIEVGKKLFADYVEPNMNP